MLAAHLEHIDSLRQKPPINFSGTRQGLDAPNCKMEIIINTGHMEEEKKRTTTCTSRTSLLRHRRRRLISAHHIDRQGPIDINDDLKM